MTQRPLLKLAAPAALLLAGLASAAPLLQETVLQDRDLSKLGDAMAEWLEARKEQKGIGDALEEIGEQLEKLGKRAKGDMLALPADIGRAWWLSSEYDKKRVDKGKLSDEIFETSDFRDMPYVYRAPKSYNPRKQSYPLILCAHDEGQSPEEHLREDWLSEAILDNAILISPQLPEDAAAWSETMTSDGGERVLGGLGCMMMAFRVATETFAIDFDRIYVAGRGAGVELAHRTADYAPDRFAGLIGRNGDAGDTPAENFGNLPSMFVAAGAKATAFEESAKALGFETVRLAMSASEEDVWSWMEESPRKAYPEEIVFYPRGRSTRAYWLQVAPQETQEQRKVVASIDRAANKLTLESETVDQVVIYFNDVMFDLSKPVVVEANGVSREIQVPRDIQRTLGYFFNARCDPGRVFVYDEAVQIQLEAPAEK